jgi:hypothetical protein
LFSCSNFLEIFLFACNWLVNFSLSFCSCCILCWTLSSSLSMVHHHHQHSHVFVVQQVVLECVLSS